MAEEKIEGVCYAAGKPETSWPAISISRFGRVEPNVTKSGNEIGPPWTWQMHEVRIQAPDMSHETWAKDYNQPGIRDGDLVFRKAGK